jgi:thiamine biosynthesis lipoprotein
MNTVLSNEKVFSKGLRLMGNHFELSVLGGEEQWALERIDDAITEIRRIEALLTTFQETSQTNLINTNAGIKPVRVDKEVFDLIERSLRISAMTQGAFDITYGSIDKKLWNFDITMTTLPDPKIARSMIRLINYRNVVLDGENHTVYLREKGMRIGFGGIGKGYAADRARIVLQHAGVKSGIVNAAGDLTVWGKQADGKPWTIGVADPEKKDFPFASLQLTDVSVATSGSYEKYAVIGGKKYSHTIDPKTGYPVQGIKSVTIICNSGEIADAMATPVMVMGIKAGLHLINQLKDIACIIVDDNNRIFTSTNINLKDANHA